MRTVNARSSTVLTLALALVAAVSVGGSSAATVVPRLYLSPNGNDNGRCSKSAPCKSFRGAYAVARSGDVVELAGGQYSSQQIPPSSSLENAAKNVVFQPAPGARVSAGSLKVYGSHVEFRDLAIDGYDTFTTAHNVVFRRVDTSGFWIWGSSNVSIIGGDVGPLVNDTPYISYEGGSSVPPTNIVVDGVRFHDMTATGDTHTECLMVSGGHGITIRRSSFRNCFYFDIFFTQWSGPDPPAGILLENNVFASAINGGFYSVYFSDHMREVRDATLRYNSALQSFGFAPGMPLAGVSLIANVTPMSRGECNRAVTYAYNVWDGARCSATDRNARAGYLDGSALNLRVSNGSPAINSGDPASFPRTDFTGRKRPAGGRPDAGAFEIR
jgi:hypothetical protein